MWVYNMGHLNTVKFKYFYSSPILQTKSNRRQPLGQDICITTSSRLHWEKGGKWKALPHFSWPEHHLHYAAIWWNITGLYVWHHSEYEKCTWLSLHTDIPEFANERHFSPTLGIIICFSQLVRNFLSTNWFFLHYCYCPESIFLTHSFILAGWPCSTREADAEFGWGGWWCPLDFSWHKSFHMFHI